MQRMGEVDERVLLSMEGAKGAGPILGGGLIRFEDFLHRLAGQEPLN